MLGDPKNFGVGCKLEGPELENFLRAYLAINYDYLVKKYGKRFETMLPPDQEKVIMETIPRSPSIYANEKQKNGKMNLCLYDVAIDSELIFRKIIPTESENVTAPSSKVCLFVKADKQPSKETALFSLYDSFEELKAEFESKLKGFVSAEFDYEEEVGEYEFLFNYF